MSLGASITTDAATVILDGPGASFSSLAPLAMVASTGTLEILGGGSFTTATLENAGTIELAPGTLNVKGAYAEVASGAFDVGVGGPSAGGQFGQLNASAFAALFGSLDVSLIDGYSPPSGASYTVLTFPSEQGSFSAESGLYLGGGEGFAPTFTPAVQPTALDLVVVAEQAGSQTTVASTPNPSTYGQAVTFTAKVAPTVATSLPLTGTVAFYDGGTELGTAPVNQGVATYTTAALAPGTHLILAAYSGDSNFSGSTSATLPQVVNQDASTTGVTTSLNPSVWGQAVTFTATVASAVPGLGTPTGEVGFYDGTQLLDTETLADGTASYTTAALAVGGHSVTAVYDGDTNFLGSTSTATNQVVNQDGTATTLASSLNPSYGGEAVTFTATVSAVAPGVGTASGQVTFYDGTTPIDTETLSGGSASFTTSTLGVGGHSITASYVGDADFASSNSTAVLQTVLANPPATLNGEVYIDANGSGTVAAGAGLSGWTVNLLDSSSQVIAATTTDPMGDYSFAGVVPGSYTIAVVAQTGYVATVPAPGTLAVSPGRGQTINGLDFGEFLTVTIAGEVFDDANDNGTLDPEEPGLSGWTVNLLDGSSQVVQATTTDSHGDFSLSGVGPGKFTLAEVVQSGYIQTAPATATYAIATSSGVDLSGEDFGDLSGPSLSVTGLALTPASGLQSGASFVVSWSDTDVGDAPVNSSYTDLVTLTNQTTGKVLAQAAVPYNESTRGKVAPGSSAAQQYPFRLPDGDPGVGQIEVTVVANADGSLIGYRATAGGTASITESSTIAPYPDLQVQDLSVSPASIMSGGTIRVNWDDADTGNAPVDQPFIDDLTIVNKTTGATLLNTTVAYGPSTAGVSPIAAGGSCPQADSFTLPQGNAGVGDLTSP